MKEDFKDFIEASGLLNYDPETISKIYRKNPNRLFKLTPTFIGDKDENRPFEIFCDMVGQHFDPIWTHIKEYTQIRDNSHTLGVSKNLVYYALRTLGIDTFDQFENEDLVNYIFGQKLTPNDTSTVITGSNKVPSGGLEPPAAIWQTFPAKPDVTA